MINKVIDFKKSKEKLINKKFPNVSPISNNVKETINLESNKAFEKFQTIFFEYQECLANPKNNKNIKLEEVLLYFNRYFEEIYKLFSNFSDDKVKKFKEALDYAMLSSGKRIRPFLMFVTYNFFEGKNPMVIAPLMVSMELIHTFSLVHDDLPCMDNDELRRGKPTVWKKYGEDVAVLVGDALLMQSMSIMLDSIFEFAYTDIGSFVITSTNIMTKLAGLEGMITGQVFDVMNTGNKNLTISDIVYMYDKKTTALLTASMMVGANMAITKNEQLMDIERLGILLGESYQIKDDLLEFESSTEVIGKSVDSDKKNGKITYVSKVGINNARKRLDYLFYNSIAVIDKLTNANNYKEALVYKELIKFLIRREK